jgi:hypothetical protein
VAQKTRDGLAACGATDDYDRAVDAQHARMAGWSGNSWSKR